jgi:8-oxo-dGTP pyrophosphatase MutT (NUDIX family)
VIERVSSREVYSNPWMRVREDEVRFADGSPGIYSVVEKPDFALIVPWDGVVFYLVEQYRYPVAGRFWEFPQGSWDDRAGGRPREALARAELEEETGLRAGRLTHLGHLYEACGFSDQGFDVYVAEDLEQGEQRLTPSEQDLVVGRFTRDELERMVRACEIKDAPSVAALALFALNRL